MIRADILSQLLLMQTLLGSLPDRKSVQDFVCRGLADVPGVGTVMLDSGCSDEEEDPVPGGRDVQEARYRCSRLDPCCFRLAIADPLEWRDYREFVANFFFMVGMVLDDQTHRAMIKRYEAELVLKEKIASVQPMVSILAHGLNTPLGNILTMAGALDQESTVLQSRTGSGMTRRDLEDYLRRMKEGLGLVLKDARQAADMVSRYRELLDDRELNHRSRFRLDELIRDSLAIWKEKLEAHDIRMVCDELPPLTMHSSPALMLRVLDHLLDNALVHAFETGHPGTLVIQAREIREHDHPVAVLEIRDDGKGMDSEVRQQVFNPFFTTDMTRGSGLGLSMAWNLVNNLMGGTIQVESEPGKGSCFRLRLPLEAPGSREPGAFKP